MKDGPYEPVWSSLETHEQIPDWFVDAKFGVYFHWGPYSVPAYGSEWYSRNMYEPDHDVYEHHCDRYGHPSEFGYKDFIPQFTAEQFDADDWARHCADAGAEFVGLTVEHHDGFAMWDSDLTPWNAADMGPERDVVGELADAIRQRGMKFVATFHHAHKWWHYPRDPAFDTTDPEFADLYGPYSEGDETPPKEYFETWRDRTIEVIDRYRPALIYFDWGWGNQPFLEQDSYRREVIAHYYNAADGWEKDVGVCHKRDLPSNIGIHDYERDRSETVRRNTWLTDTSVDRDSWGHVRDPTYKSARTLIEGFVDRLSKNGNTLLNVGPRADGTIPDAAVSRLAWVGSWLSTNNEAVYDTRSCWTSGHGPTDVETGEFEAATRVSFTDRDVRFTRSGDGGTLYAFCMDWPADGTVPVETNPYQHLSARATDVEPPRRIELLATGEPLEFDLDSTGREDILRVDLPDAKPASVDGPFAMRITL
ncbi:MAG: alpha-L-fucosidase [Halobacteriales archaeon]